MKKFFAIALTLMLLIAAVVMAEQQNNAAPQTEVQNEIEPLNGYILEINDDGSFLIRDQFGRDILVKTNEETVFDRTEEKLEINQFVFVDYNGIMSRSLPAQITALRIFGATIEGEVTAIDDLAVSLNTETLGEIIVNLSEDMALPVLGEQIRVHYNGAMTMSLPAQIGAVVFEVIPPENARN